MASRPHAPPSSPSQAYLAHFVRQSHGKINWTKRQTGVIGTGTLSLEQQQILAPIPRWKKEWVRPTSLKPGQNPNFRILKWVRDESQDNSEGTEEEMQAALQEVTSGNVPLPAAPIDPNATISLFPTTSSSAPAAAPSSTFGTAVPPHIPAATLAGAPNPVQRVMHADPSKPVAEQAKTIGGGETSVGEAVKPLQHVPTEGAIGTGGEVSQQERSLVE
ncbi:hypothetical protein JCM11641_003487 [Rhodosporidiobolus odoratus]